LSYRPRVTTRALNQLARLCGVLTEYQDWKQVRRQASPEALTAVLATLGFDLGGPAGAAEALAAERARRWRRPLAPCAVAWAGQGALDVGLAAGADGRYAGALTAEDGRVERIEGRLADLPVTAAAGVDGAVWLRRSLPLPPLAVGYYRVALDLGGAPAEGLVIAAPERAWGAPGCAPPTWGVFAPAYAAGREDDLGCGDLAALARLGDWVAERGGTLVGTLPMLASFLDRPYEPSPYSAVSKLFWNELFLVPDAADGADAADPALAAEAAALRALPRVAYRRQMALKRRLLAPAAERAWARERAAIDAFVAARPRVEDYARFRAAVERDGRPWSQWSQPRRDGALTAADYDAEGFRFHVYVQYRLQQQLGALAAKAGQGGAGLYLDLPVGVNRDGYDVWRERDVFALGMAAGAPPDALFSGGQDWGFPPLHPVRLRERGYDYLIECLRVHLEHAAMLRIDHVMGFYRLYWIPDGMPATEGVYVRYPAEELLAVHVLESQRQRCALVGEDLGTVPAQVPEAMRRHGLHRLFVAQFALPGEEGAEMAAPPADTVASLNTHDMPTFAGFWAGQEIDDRVDLGLLSADEAAAEWQARLALRQATIAWLRREGLVSARDPAVWSEVTARGAAEQILAEVVRGCTLRLAASAAQVVLITLDDLWLETAPQNVPGTGWERPNWRRKMRRALEQIFADPEIAEIIARIDELRRRAGGAEPAGSPGGCSEPAGSPGGCSEPAGSPGGCSEPAGSPGGCSEPAGSPGDGAAPESSAAGAASSAARGASRSHASSFAVSPKPGGSPTPAR
jgi:4-alpha-glucanotransferase